MNKKLPFLEMRLLGFRVVKTETDAIKLGAYLRAVENGDASKVRRLLREGADPNRRVFTESMLILATRKNRTEVIRALLAAGANPNIERGRALLWAIDWRNSEAIHMLIAAGANVNLRGSGDLPALTDACFSGNTKIVKALIEAGADLNKRCEVKLKDMRVSTEATPLMIAVWEGHIDVVKTLLNAGANTSAKDSLGSTALDWAGVNNKSTEKAILSLLENTNAATGAGVKTTQLQPNFSSAARQRNFQEMLSELKKLVRKSPSPLRAADGALIKGGMFYVSSEEKAKGIVTKYQQQYLSKGCFIFWTKDQSHVLEYGIGILPTTDVFEAIAAIQTDGANYELSNEDIIEQMRKLLSKQPFKLTGVGFDFLAGNFLSPIKEPDKLANLVFKLCPEIGDKKTAAKQIRQTNDLFLWWD